MTGLTARYLITFSMLLCVQETAGIQRGGSTVGNCRCHLTVGLGAAVARYKDPRRLRPAALIGHDIAVFVELCHLLVGVVFRRGADGEEDAVDLQP